MEAVHAQIGLRVTRSSSLFDSVKFNSSYGVIVRSTTS